MRERPRGVGVNSLLIRCTALIARWQFIHEHLEFHAAQFPLRGAGIIQTAGGNELRGPRRDVIGDHAQRVRANPISHGLAVDLDRRAETIPVHMRVAESLRGRFPFQIRQFLIARRAGEMRLNPVGMIQIKRVRSRRGHEIKDLASADVSLQMPEPPGRGFANDLRRRTRLHFRSGCRIPCTGRHRQQRGCCLQAIQPPQCNRRLGLHVIVGITKRGHQLICGHRRAFTGNIRQRPQRELPDLGIVQQLNEKGMRVRMLQLFERENGRNPTRHAGHRFGRLLQQGHERRRRSPLQDFLLGRQSQHVAVGIRQVRHQGCRILRRKFRVHRPAGRFLRTDPHDVSGLLSGVIERRPFPGSHIGIATRIHFHIRGTLDFQQRILRDRKARVLVRQLMTINGIATPVTGVERIVISGRPAKAFLLHINTPHPGSPAENSQHRKCFIGEMDELPGIPQVHATKIEFHARVPTAAIVGIVPGKYIQPRIHRHFVNIARAGGIQFHARAIRPHPHHATRPQLHFPSIGSLRLHESKIADRQIQPAIDPQRHPVGGVVRRTFAEIEPDPLDQHLALLGDAIAILVRKRLQFRRMQADDRPAHHRQSARTRHRRCKNRPLVRLPVTIPVHQLVNKSAIRLGIDRPIFVHGDIKVPIGRGLHKGGVIHHGRGRKQGGLQARRKFGGQRLRFRHGCGNGGQDEQGSDQGMHPGQEPEPTNWQPLVRGASPTKNFHCHPRQFRIPHKSSKFPASANYFKIDCHDCEKSVVSPP